jgi:hypothetical protein
MPRPAPQRGGSRGHESACPCRAICLETRHRKRGPFVYRLGHQVFNLGRGVRLPYGLPQLPVTYCYSWDFSPCCLTLSKGWTTSPYCCHPNGRGLRPWCRSPPAHSSHARERPGFRRVSPPHWPAGLPRPSGGREVIRRRPPRCTGPETRCPAFRACRAARCRIPLQPGDGGHDADPRIHLGGGAGCRRGRGRAALLRADRPYRPAGLCHERCWPGGVERDVPSLRRGPGDARYAHRAALSGAVVPGGIGLAPELDARLRSDDGAVHPARPAGA